MLGDFMTKNYKQYSLEEKRNFIRELLKDEKATHYFSVDETTRTDYHLLSDGLIMVDIGENRTKDKMASSLVIKSGIWLKENYCKITDQTFLLVKEGVYNKQYAIIEHKVSYLGTKVKDQFTILTDEENSIELIQPITMPLKAIEKVYGFSPNNNDKTTYYDYLRTFHSLEEPIMIFDEIKQKKLK